MKHLESLAKILGVRVEDLVRLVEHPVARVTVSAPGGFHVQSSVAAMAERAAAEVKALSKSVKSPKAEGGVHPAGTKSLAALKQPTNDGAK